MLFIREFGVKIISPSVICLNIFLNSVRANKRQLKISFKIFKMQSEFILPVNKQQPIVTSLLPCPFSAQGMQMPRHMQPPPMYGPRGATIPPRHLYPYNKNRFNKPTFKPTPPRYPRFPNNRHNNHFNKAQSKEFWCETCDRDFQSETFLKEHVAEHQICGIDGCQFTGHELIITKHIEMQHSSGLYNKIKKLSTPEDIKEWREERRKRYPTKANIELRQKAQEERFKRGEYLEDPKSRFGRKSDRRTGNGQNQKNDRNEQPSRKRRRKPKKKIFEKKIQEKNEDKEVDEHNGTVPMFKGTSQLENYEKPKIAIKVHNALLGLLGMYGSDDSVTENDSEDEENKIQSKLNEMSDTESYNKNPIPMKIQKIINETECDEQEYENIENEQPLEKHPVKRMEISMNELNVSNATMSKTEEKTEYLDNDMDEPPEEQPVERSTELQINLNNVNMVNEIPIKASGSESTIGNDNKRTGGKPNLKNKKRSTKQPTILDLAKRYRNQNTMLEKLLQTEIRHERNVLLQCVRHVVSNNFFMIGQKKS